MRGKMLLTLVAISLGMPGTVVAKPFNDGPVAVDDYLTIPCYRLGYLVPVLANDSDPDGDALTIVSATASAGNVDINSNALEYESFDPGTAEIYYTISDGHGGSDIGVVHVTITGNWWQCGID